MLIFLNENNYIISFDNLYISNYQNGLEVNFENLPEDFYNNYNKYKYIDNQFIYDDTFYNQQILENIKNKKLNEISKQCEEIIYKGIDCETTQGIEHFSLTEKDQINLSNCYNIILQENKQVLYHSDNNICRLFSCDEITNIYKKAIEFITYHRTYCNHLNIWIKRCENIEELNSIYYGCELPDDLKDYMTKILNNKK